MGQLSLGGPKGGREIRFNFSFVSAIIGGLKKLVA